MQLLYLFVRKNNKGNIFVFSVYSVYLWKVMKEASNKISFKSDKKAFVREDLGTNYKTMQVYSHPIERGNLCFSLEHIQKKLVNIVGLAKP